MIVFHIGCLSIYDAPFCDTLFPQSADCMRVLCEVTKMKNNHVIMNGLDKENKSMLNREITKH